MKRKFNLRRQEREKKKKLYLELGILTVNRKRRETMIGPVHCEQKQTNRQKGESRKELLNCNEDVSKNKGLVDFNRKIERREEKKDKQRKN